MKNQLKDQLTYSDLGGHRHLRRYVLATLIIVMLILAIIAYGFWRRTQERAQFSGASLPLSNIHETQTATALPVDDEDQTAAFTPNPPIATPFTAAMIGLFKLNLLVKPAKPLSGIAVISPPDA